MKHSLALALAEHLARAMRPHCVEDSACIVGSVHRGKPEVKDIEILVLPRWDEDAGAEDLFGERPRLNALHVWATSERTRQVIRWVKGGRGKLERGVSTLEETTPNPSGSYWRGYLPEQHLMLDLFLATPENYGGLEVIRTGPAEFSEAILAHARKVLRLVACEGAGGRLATPRDEDAISALVALVVGFLSGAIGWGAAACERGESWCGRQTMCKITNGSLVPCLAYNLFVLVVAQNELLGSGKVMATRPPPSTGVV